jgi:hypothetical protein
MLMVIFGAGASYDSWSSRRVSGRAIDERNIVPSRPPLADELFSNVPEFRKLLDAYPKCRPLVPRLEPQAKGSVSLEDRLEQFDSQASTDPERQRQLLSIRYYLRDLIQDCEHKWTQLTNGVSNYATLLDDIRRGSESMLVTFNYDTLIERALADLGVQIGGMRNYIDSAFPLIKFHGSIDWVQWVEVDDAPPGGLRPEELILHARSLRNVGEPRKVGAQQPSGDDSLSKIPALAIPVVTKSQFICPQSHIDRLKEFLPKVEKILVIGWRGSEKHFLKLLSEGLQNPVKVLSVCGRPDDSAHTNQNMEGAGVRGTFFAAEGGFSDLLLSGECENFIRG